VKNGFRQVRLNRGSSTARGKCSAHKIDVWRRVAQRRAESACKWWAARPNEVGASCERTVAAPGELQAREAQAIKAKASTSCGRVDAKLKIDPRRDAKNTDKLNLRLGRTEARFGRFAYCERDEVLSRAITSDCSSAAVF